MGSHESPALEVEAMHVVAHPDRPYPANSVKIRMAVFNQDRSRILEKNSVEMTPEEADTLADYLRIAARAARAEAR